MAGFKKWMLWFVLHQIWGYSSPELSPNASVVFASSEKDNDELMEVEEEGEKKVENEEDGEGWFECHHVMISNKHF